MNNDFFEKTLEDIIVENKDVIHLRGFPKLLENTMSQFVLPSGKKIDILSFAIDEGLEGISFKIFELKRDVVQVDALCQVSEYASELYASCTPHFKHVNIERYVVGKDYSPQVILLMEAQISIDFYLYKYTISGIFFKQSSSFMESSHNEIQKILYTSSDASISLYQKLWKLNNDNKKSDKQ